MEVQILSITGNEFPQCDICKQTINEGQYARFEYTDDDRLDWAHTSCIAATIRCEICRGRGWIRDPNAPAPTLGDLLGIGGTKTVTCPVCDHKGHVPTNLTGEVIDDARNGTSPDTQGRPANGKLESNSTYGRKARIGGCYP